MTPPPTMTTSAVSKREAPELEDDLQRGEDRDLRGIERWRDLGQVQPDQPASRGESCQQLERLPGGEPCRRRDLRAGRESRVQHIDVEGDVHRPAGEQSRQL